MVRTDLGKTWSRFPEPIFGARSLTRLPDPRRCLQSRGYAIVRAPIWIRSRSPLLAMGHVVFLPKRLFRQEGTDLTLSRFTSTRGTKREKTWSNARFLAVGTIHGASHIYLKRCGQACCFCPDGDVLMSFHLRPWRRSSHGFRPCVPFVLIGELLKTSKNRSGAA